MPASDTLPKEEPAVVPNAIDAIPKAEAEAGNAAGESPGKEEQASYEEEEFEAPGDPVHLAWNLNSPSSGGGVRVHWKWRAALAKVFNSTACDAAIWSRVVGIRCWVSWNLLRRGRQPSLWGPWQPLSKGNLEAGLGSHGNFGVCSPMLSWSRAMGFLNRWLLGEGSMRSLSTLLPIREP